MNANPSIIIQLEQNESEAVKRLAKRRIDPETGASYNLAIDLLSNEDLKKRLVTAPEDSKKIIEKGHRIWKENLADIEEHFKDTLKVLPVTGRSVEDTAE
jgi:hypothetical protein